MGAAGVTAPPPQGRVLQVPMVTYPSIGRWHLGRQAVLTCWSEWKRAVVPFNVHFAEPHVQQLIWGTRPPVPGPHAWLEPLRVVGEDLLTISATVEDVLQLHGLPYRIVDTDGRKLQSVPLLVPQLLADAPRDTGWAGCGGCGLKVRPVEIRGREYALDERWNTWCDGSTRHYVARCHVCHIPVGPERRCRGCLTLLREDVDCSACGAIIALQEEPLGSVWAPTDGSPGCMFGCTPRPERKGSSR